MTGALIISQTVPTIIAFGVVSEATKLLFRKREGAAHYHFKGKKPFRHSHGGGYIRHEHRGLKGFGRTRKSLRRL